MASPKMLTSLARVVLNEGGRHLHPGVAGWGAVNVRIRDDEEDLENDVSEPPQPASVHATRVNVCRRRLESLRGAHSLLSVSSE